MDLIRLQDAARALGVSYPTLKQWIYSEKISSVQTAGGHHRIPQNEIDRILEKTNCGTKSTRAVETASLEAISGRNKLFGKVTEVRYEGLLAQISIDVGGQMITSTITADSARSLDLKKGASVYALVKATEVMVIRG